MEHLISASEFAGRLAAFQRNIREAGLDACLVHGNEADFPNVRYLSDYWPIFETAGVWVPARGDAVLLIGPESETYAVQRSMIPRIAKMLCYRKFAEPQYPSIPVAGWRDVVAMSRTPKLEKLGIVSWSITPLPVWLSLREELPEVELVKADDTLRSLRVMKSESEMNCLRAAFRISELAIEAILNEIRPGMTELQVVGIAQRTIYENGAEYEGMPQYVFCGQSTNNAISRPTANRIVPHTMIQLNISARVGGYSSGVGVPVSFGKLPDHQRILQEFGLEAHRKTLDLIHAGKKAAEVVREYEEFVRRRGFEKHLLYGPCHGLGMQEVEPPWMETSSDYELQENMTFQADTFFCDVDFGLRWENGFAVRKQGVELFSEKFMKIIVL